MGSINTPVHSRFNQNGRRLSNDEVLKDARGPWQQDQIHCKVRRGRGKRRSDGHSQALSTIETCDNGDLDTEGEEAGNERTSKHHLPFWRRRRRLSRSPAKIVTRLTATTAVVPGGVVIEQPLSESFPLSPCDDSVVEGPLSAVAPLAPVRVLFVLAIVPLPPVGVTFDVAIVPLPPEGVPLEVATALPPPEGEPFDVATAPLPPVRVLFEVVTAPLPPEEIPFDPAIAPLPPVRVPFEPATAPLPPEEIPFDPATPGAPAPATLVLGAPPVAGGLARYSQIVFPPDTGHGAV